MGSEVTRVNEIAGMYGSKHCADGIFFTVRPDDSFVVTEDDSISRKVRWVQEGMERLEFDRCLHRSKHRNPAFVRKGAI